MQNRIETLALHFRLFAMIGQGVFERGVRCSCRDSAQALDHLSLDASEFLRFGEYMSRKLSICMLVFSFGRPCAQPAAKSARLGHRRRTAALQMDGQRPGSSKVSSAAS
jgi:hypothetical protein